jgi:hypothetical protein
VREGGREGGARVLYVFFECNFSFSLLIFWLFLASISLSLPVCLG